MLCVNLFFIVFPLNLPIYPKYSSMYLWQRLSGASGMSMDWHGAPASPSSYTVKRILRLEIPLETYPNVRDLFIILAHRLLVLYSLYELTSRRISVQFCWATSGSQGQFLETGGSYYRMSCVY